MLYDRYINVVGNKISRPHLTSQQFFIVHTTTRDEADPNISLHQPGHPTVASTPASIRLFHRSRSPSLYIDMSVSLGVYDLVMLMQQIPCMSYPTD